MQCSYLTGHRHPLIGSAVVHVAFATLTDCASFTCSALRARSHLSDSPAAASGSTLRVVIAPRRPRTAGPWEN